MALSERDRRIAIIGGGVVGAVVVIFLVFNLLGGGGENAVSPGPVIPTGPVPPPTSPSAPIAPSPVVVFGGRDPFSIPPALSPTTSPSASMSPSTSFRTSRRSTEEIGGHIVTLMAAVAQGDAVKVKVSVDQVTYLRAPGQMFAQSFAVRSITGSCATFVYGDQSFDLCATQ